MLIGGQRNSQFLKLCMCWRVSCHALIANDAPSYSNTIAISLSLSFSSHTHTNPQTCILLLLLSLSLSRVVALRAPLFQLGRSPNSSSLSLDSDCRWTPMSSRKLNSPHIKPTNHMFRVCTLAPHPRLQIIYHAHRLTNYTEALTLRSVNNNGGQS